MAKPNTYLSDIFEKIVVVDDKNSIDFLREQNMQYVPYQYYKESLLAIKSGDIDLLHEVAAQTLAKNSKFVLGKVGDDSFDVLKHLVLSIGTLASFSAMEIGVNEMEVQDFNYHLSKNILSAKDPIELADKFGKIDELVLMIKEHLDGNCEDGRIIMCQNYISDNLYNKITRKDLALLTGLSENRISTLFSSALGITLSDYILKQKIRESKKLFEISNMNICDVALKLGFSSQSHFTRYFKKFTGITPQKYLNSKIKNI